MSIGDVNPNVQYPFTIVTIHIYLYVHDGSYLRHLCLIANKYLTVYLRRLVPDQLLAYSMLNKHVKNID